jgi:type I restriction enzyme M protein
LLLNVRRRMLEVGGTIGKIYGQEYNITTYNLCRMNMLLHGLKDTEFEIYYGVAPKSAADFAFLLHGFHYLKDDGVMAIILPHGVLFRGRAEARIRRKLLEDGHIDTVIGLPANLFYSTGIPVCILLLKKCKKPDDVLFINAEKHFEKGKRQNHLSPEHIAKIIDTYQQRPEKIERYARRVGMDEIEENDYNLNISRYVSTAEPEPEIDLAEVHQDLASIEEDIQASAAKHNTFLKELGLPPLPGFEQ